MFVCFVFALFFTLIPPPTLLGQYEETKSTAEHREPELELTVITKIEECWNSIPNTAVRYEVELRYHLDSSSPAFIFLISLASIINHNGRHGVKARLPADRKLNLLKIKVKMQVCDRTKVQLSMFCVCFLQKTKLLAKLKLNFH